MILRIPWLGESSHAFTSLVILSTSSAMILRTYNQLSATNFFRAKWTESRRILTTAYVQLYCTIEGEVAPQDFQSSSTIVTELLVRSGPTHPAVVPLIKTWQTLSHLISKSIVSHIPPRVVPNHTVSSQPTDMILYSTRDNVPFDYTLPPDERRADWNEGQELTFQYD
jgi:hypothetical protein